MGTWTWIAVQDTTTPAMDTRYVEMCLFHFTCVLVVSLLFRISRIVLPYAVIQGNDVGGTSALANYGGGGAQRVV